MLNLLNNPTFDGKRNDLNADLFVSNLKNNLKAFGFNPKVTYKVYRTITIYHIKWLDDKDYNDLLKYKREIALSLGINTEVLRIEKVKSYLFQILRMEPILLMMDYFQKLIKVEKGSLL